MELSQQQLQIISNSRFDKESAEISLFDVLEHILGGYSVITLHSLKTGVKFTYRIEQMVDYVHGKPVKKDMYYLNLKTGPDNYTDYSYAGVIQKNNNKWAFRFTKKSNMTEDSLGVTIFVMLLSKLQQNFEVLNTLRTSLKVYHDGSCGKCGKSLTDIISVNTGFGPVCSPHIHKAYKAEAKRRGIKIKSLSEKV